MDIILYHNPRCSKSRQTLQLIQDKGIEPTIIEYLKTPPTHQQLDSILRGLEIEPRELMRTKEEQYKTRNLSDSKLTRDQLIDAMITTPKLIERPIFIVGDQVVIGRPPENALTILP
ncbi:arsenate reductase (glutaredoxin) [Arenicella sp. 4NH20-0111]|uniref:arsenate reductase (glutaredoxin) n=1 Tax=Arenicella sp. 4NH20-0111 TaxID=3127648 RepID=UPI003101F5A4